jgi:hypothetical protein
MMICFNEQVKINGLLKMSFIFFLVSVGYLPVNAQEKPPRPMAIYFYQNLNFGAFAVGSSGGYVYIDPYGGRNATGDIVLFTSGYPYFPAIFEIDANPGTVVHLLLGPDAILTGSNGGTLTLHLWDYIPGDPIIIYSSPPARTQVFIGGRLTVSNLMSNPPGSYSGLFELMFVQE